MEAILQLFGYLTQFPTEYVIISAFLLAIACAYLGTPLWIWAIAGYALLFGYDSPTWVVGTYSLLALIFNVPIIRKNLISIPIMKLMEALKFLPIISDTEKTAIDAGTVWMDGDLFSGKPNLKRIL